MTDAIQSLSKNLRQIALAERLAQKEDARVEPTVMDDGVFGVSRHEHDLDTGPLSRHLIRQGSAGQRSGHDDIRQDKIEWSLGSFKGRKTR
jgi:hypothetical protein